MRRRQGEASGEEEGSQRMAAIALFLRDPGRPHTATAHRWTLGACYVQNAGLIYDLVPQQTQKHVCLVHVFRWVGAK